MPEEIQTQYNASTPVGYAAFSRAGQKLTITNRSVSKLGFWLHKVGTPPGNVTFAIYAEDDDEVLGSKLLGTADSLTTSPVFYEVTFASPADISEEVYIAVVDTESNLTNYVRVNAQSTDVKASEVLATYYTGAWHDSVGVDCAYVYTYASGASSAPSVTTQACTNTIAEKSTGNGTMVDLGDSAVTQHGHCWATTTNPDTDDSKTQKGAIGQTGQFQSAITGLTPGTLYYVRAYATNTTGTSYGVNVTITADSTIGRRYWWVEKEDFHWFGESGTERKAEGEAVTLDNNIMDWFT